MPHGTGGLIAAGTKDAEINDLRKLCVKLPLDTVQIKGVNRLGFLGYNLIHIIKKVERAGNSDDSDTHDGKKDYFKFNIFYINMHGKPLLFCVLPPSG